MQPRSFFHIIIVCVLMIADVLSQVQLFEGDECLLGESGFYGECKKWDDCPGSSVNVVNGRQPSICSFTQRSAIICCPINRSQRSNHTAAPSTLAASPGGACTLRNEAQGECKSIQDCPRVLNSIRNSTLPVLCGFNHTTPIVCCPANIPSPTNRPPQRTQTKNNGPRRTTTTQSTDTSTTSSTSSTVGEKSEQMCEYFSQFAFQFVQAPILLVNAEFYNESVCAIREHTPNQAPLRDAEEVVYREFPHVAVLGYGPKDNTQWLCGGSLISERFILTTAHCINPPNNGLVRWVRVADLSPTVYSASRPPTFAVEERIVHEGYREASPSVHDIALIKLESDVSFVGGTARPACLYTHPGNPPGHKYATSVGWGMAHWNDTTVTVNMMRKDLTLVPENQCSSSSQRSPNRRRQVRRRQESSKICVLDASPAPSSCVGNVGSPLQIVLDAPHCMHAIVGLTSFGPRACADGATPATYTRVSDYISWIETHVWP